MLKKQFQCSTHCRVNGFTVLELLVVVAILAAVAMIATSSFMGGGRNVETEAKIKIAKAEMAAIAKAVKQFKADTGYYPKEGFFAHQDDGGQTTGSVEAGMFTVDAFNAPYNLDQLFYQPINSTSATELLPWDPVSGYGWNGPYIARSAVYLASADDRIATMNGTIDDPTNVFHSVSIPGLHDHFSLNEKFSIFNWTTIRSPNVGDDSKSIGHIGGPYMVVGLDAGTPINLRVVSLGVDGEYEGLSNTTAPSSRDNCAPNTSGESDSIKVGYKRELILCF